MMRSTRCALARAPLVRTSAASRGLHVTAARRKVHEIKTTEEFQQVISKHSRVVVDCFADWCGPCKAIAPILAKHSEEPTLQDRVHFVKVDVDGLPAVAQALGVRAMPTFAFFQGGKKVDELVGADPAALGAAVRKLAGEGAK